MIRYVVFVTSFCPSSATHNLYLSELVMTTKQYSTPPVRYTGDSKVKVVAVAAVELSDTALAAFVTFEKGTTVCVGVPFIIVRISTETGAGDVADSSFSLKYKSIPDRKTPPSVSIKIDWARGSDQRIRPPCSSSHGSGTGSVKTSSGGGSTGTGGSTTTGTSTSTGGTVLRSHELVSDVILCETD